jgi:NAD(P)-dependent dehydrogenase (short-subunit alcohol dehydrogenase family)
MKDLTILVTGATDGIGRATAFALARRGAALVVHGRDAARLDAVAAEIERTAGRRPATALADFADLAAVRALVDDLAGRFPRIDVLINNAGLGAGPKGGRREATRGGTELRMAVNFVAPFALTEGWLARRGASPAVVNVSSLGQERLDFADVNAERRYDGLAQYCRSKYALTAWTFELARRRPDVAVNALHPGTLLDTKMVRETFGFHRGPVDAGATAIVRVMERTLAGETGGFFDGNTPARAHQGTYETIEQSRIVALARALVARG